MKLNKKSWHIRYYQQWYKTDDRPQSLCVYFWKLVIALLLFPITYPSLILNKIFNNDSSPRYGIPGGVGFMIYFVLFVAGIAISSPGKNEHFHISMFMGIVVLPFITLISLCVFIIILAGVGFGIYELFRYLKSKLRINKITKSKKAKTPNIVGEYIKAFFGKYCPKIDWE